MINKMKGFRLAPLSSFEYAMLVGGATLYLTGTIIGCGLKLPPMTPHPPPTDPPVTQPSPVCEGEGKTACWVQPSAGVWKFVCPAPWITDGILLADLASECPAAPVVPPPPPPPDTPNPEACGFPAGRPPFEEVPSAPLYRDAVREAAQACLGCEPGAAGCKWPAGPVEAYACVISKLQAEGYCAGRYDDDRSGPYSGSDSLSVKAKDAEDWHEWELFNYGGALGAHASKLSHAGAYRLTSPPVVEPEPLQCLSLSVIRLAVEDGKAKRHVNATPQHYGLEECIAFGHQPRAYCPLGHEGDPRRAECEARFGPYEWTVTPDPGWDLAPEQDGSKNPLVIKLEARVPGVVKVCAAGGVCGEVETQ